MKDKATELRQSELLDKYVIYSATDTRGIITEASYAFSKISGYSKEELIGAPHSIVRHPEMPKDAFKQMWKTIRSGKVWEGEVQNRKKSGATYWVHARIEPVYEEQSGKIKGYFGVREDITDKKLLDQSNRDLYEQVNTVSAILDNSNSAIATIHINGYFKSVNQYFKKRFSCLEDKDVNTLKIQDLLLREERGFFEERMSALHREGYLYFKRLDFLQSCRNRQSRRTIPVELHLNLLPDGQNVVVVINFIKDKLKLKNSLKKSQTYFKKAAIGFFITDRENRILKANPKLRAIMGYEKRELKNQNIRVLFDSREKYENFCDRVKEKLAKKREFTAVFAMNKKDGEEFWAEVTASKFADHERLKNENIFWSVRDITNKIKSKQLIERQNEQLTYLNENLKEQVAKEVAKNTQKERYHQEEQVRNAKFTAIGQLAAGITHEINTPLTYIKGNFELLELDLDDIEDPSLKETVHEQLGPIKEGIERISNIIDNMREMSQKTKEEKVVTNIYATMITSLTMLHNRSKHIARTYINGKEFAIGMDREEYSFFSYAQPQRLEQVWVIILNNALDELVQVEPYEKRRLEVNIDQDELNVYVRISDNAGGIDESIMDKIFEPFESNKENKGMGIGLNVAKQIIEQQNGSINAYNDGGAHFEIKLKRHRP